MNSDDIAAWARTLELTRSTEAAAIAHLEAKGAAAITARELKDAKTRLEKHLHGLIQPLPLFDPKGSPSPIEHQAASSVATSGEEWRLLPLVELAAHGLHGATASALQTARIDALGPLFDACEHGELDELGLSDDEIDQVLAAKRSYLGQAPIVIETDIERLLEAESDANAEANEPAPTKRPRARKPKAVAVPEPPDEDGLFLVYVGSRKRPEFSLRAPSKLQALYHLKSTRPNDKTRVELDDGTTARLGLRIETISIERADPRKDGHDIPIGMIACTRCHRVRPANDHPCPDCRCPEYQLSGLIPPPVPKPKRARKSDAPGPEIRP